jgi:hypothetical protein
MNLLFIEWLGRKVLKPCGSHKWHKIDDVCFLVGFSLSILVPIYLVGLPYYHPWLK